MRTKYRLKCPRRDRNREDTGAGSVNWLLGKRMGCRFWWKRFIGRSNGRWKDNIKVVVK
jgi:hypothetical protein